MISDRRDFDKKQYIFNAVHAKDFEAKGNRPVH